MSADEVRRVSRQDIQLVQNLIERCLQLYMNRKEVVETLLAQAKIEPGFTELVWQKLEEENQEFFKAYNVRLMVKNQIMVFNKLLEKQVEYMRQTSPSGIVPLSMPNGPQTSSLHQNQSLYNADHSLPPIRSNNVHHTGSASMSLHDVPRPSNPLRNGGSVAHGTLHIDDSRGGHRERVDISRTRDTLMAMKQETNGNSDVLEQSYPNNAPFTFGGDRTILERHPSHGDSSVSTFGNAEPNSDNLNEKLPESDTSPFGFLGQIPRNFSLSDLTADFSHSFDILENYPRSPFIPADNDNLLDLIGRDSEGDNKRLNGMSEDFNYDEFSSE
ncbi:hypothetical protein ACHQM5_012745 [Ranunculus cassubicifolius]